MSIATKTDRRFRRARVKPVRPRERRRRQRRLLPVLVATGVLLSAGVRLVALVRDSEWLRVAEITVRGHERLSLEDVEAAVNGLRGRNILTVDLAAWRRELLESSWVGDAEVRRILPSTVDITISERHPIGLTQMGDALYLVDGLGVVIDEYGPEYADIDVPLIRGLVGLRPEDGLALDVERAALAGRALAALSRDDLAQRVAELDVADPSNVAVMLEGDEAVIRLGHEDFLGRLTAYLELADALRQRVPEIDYVDLRFDRRVYVRPIEAGDTMDTDGES